MPVCISADGARFPHTICVGENWMMLGVKLQGNDNVGLLVSLNSCDS